MSYDSTVHAKAVDLAKLSYEMTAAAGSGHPTTAASLTHLVAVLMYDHMRYEPANPRHPASDRLVLSEGHAVPIIYAACADLGVAIGFNGDIRPMTRDDAMTLRSIDSVVDGHPNPAEGFPFFDAATGSLGQGISIAAGLAAAARLNGLSKRIFCIIGDGESREGQIWEALDFIRDHNFKAVCPIFNCNVYAQSDVVSDQQSAAMMQKKLEAAGFAVCVVDGHNPTSIKQALDRHAQTLGDDTAAPVVIVANTLKGWGSASQQGHGHHGKPAVGDDLATVLAELDASGRQVGAASDTLLSIPLMPDETPPDAEGAERWSFTEAIDRFGMQSSVEKGKMATRRAYGVALRALGHANSNVVALDADVKNSTFADMFYQDEELTDRFFECHIAEQNMVSAAAGLSAGGKLPFVSTFAKFITRAYDQVEMAVNSGANIKLVGSHAGITLAADGPSQMSLPDVAWFRSFSTSTNRAGVPNFYLLQPSDAFAAYALVMEMSMHVGPCYMRTIRADVEFLYSDEHEFELGGHEVLSEGRDLLIVASGYMVHEANKALEQLDQAGVDATLVDLYSIPFDSEALLDLANANNGLVLTIEDNYGGGIGGAIADAVCADGGGFTVEQMFVKRTPKSGRTPDDVLTAAGLSANHIAQTATRMLDL